MVQNLPSVSELLLMPSHDRNWWRGVFVETELELMQSGHNPELLAQVSDLHESILTIENAVKAANCLSNDF